MMKALPPKVLTADFADGGWHPGSLPRRGNRDARNERNEMQNDGIPALHLRHSAMAEQVLRDLRFSLHFDLR